MDKLSQIDCMSMMDVHNMGWMMAGMWFIGILWILVLLLGIAALTKYLFFGWK